ncbi:hypothetical protein KIW84_032430 [Lathyrus oleraceus]|uniref:Uncharacterized protein n=1 Tax=Pisum sativum TaxID=3888 RepID=A0A9D4XXH2_PEA|nr:hypothetical protein KIW84_032430 [Pisum sativum]
MSYAELYPSLVLKNLIQPRIPPQIPEPLPWWFKLELRCAFHQGAPDHDIENCYPLKYEVQKLVKSGMVSFEDRAPNVKDNLLPAHGPIPYASDKVVPYQYNTTMIENGQEVPLPVVDSVVNMDDITKVTRSGRVFGSVFQKEVEDVVARKKAEILVANPVSTLVCQSGESSKLKTNEDDEVLKLIKMSEFNFMEQLF